MQQPMAAQADLPTTAALFRALGDETRLRLIALLCHGELCVCHLVAAVALPPSTVSRQLAILRQAGVVATRREGTWIYYRLDEGLDEPCRTQLELLRATFTGRWELHADLERLAHAAGPQSCSIAEKKVMS